MRKTIVALAFFGLNAVTARSWAQATSTITAVAAEATIHSIGVVAAYGGDDDADATAQLEYRIAGGPGNFVPGHALVRLSGKRWTGSVLFLQPDTPYDVRVVILDPDNAAPVQRTTTRRTRLDAPELVTGGDYWVDVALGSDAAPGTRAAPFRTIQRGADAAGAGDTVHVLPGVYREQVLPPRGGAPGAALRFLAEGTGVILDGSDAGLTTGATWTSAGPFLYWAPFTAQSIYAAIDDARIYDYQTLADLTAENGNIAMPAVFPGGFFVDAAAGRLYVITPDHSSPALHEVHVAVLPSAFLVDTLSDIVIEGFEIRYYGREDSYGSIGVDLRDSSRCWVRGNRIHHLNAAVRVRRALASENVIEDNIIRDTSVFDWPWSSVKAHTPEASAIEILHGHGNIVRCNQIDGPFNGIYTGAFGDPDEEIARDTDVHDNRLDHNGDDGLELEGIQRNVRAWRNVVRNVYNGISIAPIEAGPVFLVRNVLDGYQQHAVKVNNGTYGFVFFYHTTAIPLPGAAFPAAQALAPTIPFGAITTRNNIWEANRYVIEYNDTTLLSPIDWDHDNLYTNDTGAAGRFVKWLNVRYSNLPALKASGTIEPNGLAVRPIYENAAGGDYRPVVGSPLLDAAVVVAGINDLAVVGSAPDLGAIERGLPVAACAAAAVTPALLRNTEWPLAKALIFTGPDPGCGPPLDVGCAAAAPPGLSLDPFGPDCARGGTPRDDDTYQQPFVCGTSDPEAAILGDKGRPLVFYQIEKTPSPCNRVQLVKNGAGGVRIDCN